MTVCWAISAVSMFAGSDAATAHLKFGESINIGPQQQPVCESRSQHRAPTRPAIGRTWVELVLIDHSGEDRTKWPGLSRSRPCVGPTPKCARDQPSSGFDPAQYWSKPQKLVDPPPTVTPQNPAQLRAKAAAFCRATLNWTPASSPPLIHLQTRSGAAVDVYRHRPEDGRRLTSELVETGPKLAQVSVGTVPNGRDHPKLGVLLGRPRRPAFAGNLVAWGCP